MTLPAPLKTPKNVARHRCVLARPCVSLPGPSLTLPLLARLCGEEKPHCNDGRRHRNARWRTLERMCRACVCTSSYVKTLRVIFCSFHLWLHTNLAVSTVCVPSCDTSLSRRGVSALQQMVAYMCKRPYSKV